MKVDKISHMGSDLTVVNAARVSFDKESDWGLEVSDDHSHIKRILKNDDKRLINYLARYNHWTPFGHCQVTLRETVPIFVARERFRHTVGFVYNEVSRRYVSDTPEIWRPEVWRSKPEGSIKQGSGDQFDDQNWADDIYLEATVKAKKAYDSLIHAGIAPEQARAVLPQAMYTSYYVTGSLAAWARFYNLRAAPDAQYEIQELAEKVAEIIRPLFPISWEALTIVT
jgi:thymidylate synthase (FAD)